MKVRSLCTMSLVALLGAALVGGTPAFAVPGELESEGKVEVVEGGEPGNGKTPDPEKPNEKLPDIPGVINPNPDGGALMIDQVSNLDFGKIKTSSTEQKAYASPIAMPGGAETRGAIVGWTDIRGGAYGYTITAELTKQFTATNDANSVLHNSTIDYSNGMTVADGANSNPIPSNVKTAFGLVYSAAGDKAVDVVVASKTVGEGKGTFAMEFGQSKDYVPGTGAPAGNLGANGEGTAHNSVELKVPAASASNMNIDTYIATVTWKIVAAK